MAGTRNMTRSYDDEDFDDADSKLIAIHTAIVDNDPNALRDACTSADDVNAKFTEEIEPQHAGMTPLSLAAAFNRIDLVKILIKAKADVNATFANLKTTALMTSSFHGHTEVVRLLLERGANARAVDLQNSTALGYCFGGSRKTDVVNMLIQAGIDVNFKNILGMNALLLVAGYGNETLIRIVLEAGADPNSTNDFGHSSLHLAIVGKRSQIGTTIVSRSTPLYGLNRRNVDYVLKDWANSHRDMLRGGRVDEKELEKIGQFMMNVGEKLVDEPDGLTSDDQEAVKKRLDAVHRYRQDTMLTSKSKKSGVVDTLLSCGGRRSKQAKGTNGGSAPGDNPLSMPVVSSGNPDDDRNVTSLCDMFARIVRLLLDAGCRVETTEKTFGMTALDMAILLGDVESAVQLTAAGGDSNHLMKLFALSDLYCDIAIRPDKKRVRELLNNDEHLDVNASFTNFNVTKKTEQEEELEKLDGFPRGDDGLTPLAVASKALDNKTVEIIKMLIKQGGDINKIGSGGRSTLGEASRLGNVKMIEFLMGQGANIEQPNPAFKNATPVMIAVICKQTKIVEYLLGQGAKIDLHMSDDRTALDIAMESSDMPMIDTILEYSELSKNFYDPSGLSYRMADQYKKPDRNIESILAEISRNVEVIAEREREKERELKRQQELRKAQQAQANQLRSMPSASESTALYATPQRQQPKQPVPKSRPRHSRREDDSVDEQQSFASSQVDPPQVTENVARSGSKKAKPAKQTAAKPASKRQTQPKHEEPPPRPISDPSDEEGSDEESEVNIPAPAPAKRRSLHGKPSNEPPSQPPPQVQAAGKASKKERKVEQAPVSQVSAPVPVREPEPKKKLPPVQPPPPPAPPEDDDDESDEEESDEESDDEEEPQLQLATNAGLRGVAKFPPAQQVTPSRVQAGRPTNGVSSTVTSTSTHVTKTVVSSSGPVQTVQRAQNVRANDDDDDDDDDDEEEDSEESEEEESDEEEDVQDVNSNTAKLHIAQKPTVKSRALNHSAETDI